MREIRMCGNIVFPNPALNDPLDIRVLLCSDAASCKSLCLSDPLCTSSAWDPVAAKCLTGKVPANLVGAPSNSDTAWHLFSKQVQYRWRLNSIVRNGGFAS